MPYFVVIRSIERPATLRPGYQHRNHVRALHEPFATLAQAEDAARRQAEFEQEYPWTAVYVVEAPNWRLAQHLRNPNFEEFEYLHGEIIKALLTDPEGRVPEPTERLSAFQPPKTPPGPPAPSNLPPAAFSDPALQRSLDALVAAGFKAVARDYSVYFQDRPQYRATDAAARWARDEVMRMGGYEVAGGQQWQDLTFRDPADVLTVFQEYGLYEIDSGFEIGELLVDEIRSGESLDARLREHYEKLDKTRSMRLREQRSSPLRSAWFITERLQVGVLLWAPSGEQFAAVVAALQSVLGPAASLDGHRTGPSVSPEARG